ncbi:MAG: DUF4382 domain-containing protein [Gammaproteobacteria bacterium]|nr:DUF4382 domain-containing protein [Gammaproteobacteria bacterium]
MNKFSKVMPLLGLASLLLLSACGGTSSSGTGSLTLNITDSPVPDATQVVVAFSGVTIKPENGSAYDINFVDDNNQPVVKTIDLLNVQGMNSESLLHNHTLEAGRYNWLRLHVNEAGSYIDLSTGNYPLYIPSGDETGLKLNRPFDIIEGSTTSFTLDFDLHKSVVGPGQGKMSGSYKLRPTLRMVNNAEMGHVSGHVGATTLADASCSGRTDYAVYLFTGANIMPDDIDGTDPDPVAVSQLTDTYDYALGFLEPGSYTLAFTCQAADDDVDSSETLHFISSDSVTVIAGGNITYDFD